MDKHDSAPKNEPTETENERDSAWKELQEYLHSERLRSRRLEFQLKQLRLEKGQIVSAAETEYEAAVNMLRREVSTLMLYRRELAERLHQSAAVAAGAADNRMQDMLANETLGHSRVGSAQVPQLSTPSLSIPSGSMGALLAALERAASAADAATEAPPNDNARTAPSASTAPASASASVSALRVVQEALAAAKVYAAALVTSPSSTKAGASLTSSGVVAALSHDHRQGTVDSERWVSRGTLWTPTREDGAIIDSSIDTGHPRAIIGTHPDDLRGSLVGSASSAHAAADSARSWVDGAASIAPLQVRTKDAVAIATDMSSHMPPANAAVHTRTRMESSGPGGNDAIECPYARGNRSENEDYCDASAASRLECGSPLHDGSDLDDESDERRVSYAWTGMSEPEPVSGSRRLHAMDEAIASAMGGGSSDGGRSNTTEDEGNRGTLVLRSAIGGGRSPRAGDNSRAGSDAGSEADGGGDAVNERLSKHVAEQNAALAREWGVGVGPRGAGLGGTATEDTRDGDMQLAVGTALSVEGEGASAAEVASIAAASMQSGLRVPHAWGSASSLRGDRERGHGRLYVDDAMQVQLGQDNQNELQQYPTFYVEMQSYWVGGGAVTLSAPRSRAGMAGIGSMSVTVTERMGSGRSRPMVRSSSRSRARNSTGAASMSGVVLGSASSSRGKSGSRIEDTDGGIQHYGSLRYAIKGGMQQAETGQAPTDLLALSGSEADSYDEHDEDRPGRDHLIAEERANLRNTPGRDMPPLDNASVVVLKGGLARSSRRSLAQSSIHGGASVRRSDPDRHADRDRHSSHHNRRSEAGQSYGEHLSDGSRSRRRGSEAFSEDNGPSPSSNLALPVNPTPGRSTRQQAAASSTWEATVGVASANLPSSSTVPSNVSRSHRPLIPDLQLPATREGNPGGDERGRILSLNQAPQSSDHLGGFPGLPSDRRGDFDPELSAESAGIGNEVDAASIQSRTQTPSPGSPLVIPRRNASPAGDSGGIGSSFGRISRAHSETQLGRGLPLGIDRDALPSYHGVGIQRGNPRDLTISAALEGARKHQRARTSWSKHGPQRTMRAVGERSGHGSPRGRVSRGLHAQSPQSSSPSAHGWSHADIGSGSQSKGPGGRGSSSHQLHRGTRSARSSASVIDKPSHELVRSSQARLHEHSNSRDRSIGHGHAHLQDDHAVRSTSSGVVAESMVPLLELESTPVSHTHRPDPGSLQEKGTQVQELKGSDDFEPGVVDKGGSGYGYLVSRQRREATDERWGSMTAAGGRVRRDVRDRRVSWAYRSVGDGRSADLNHHRASGVGIGVGVGVGGRLGQLESTGGYMYLSAGHRVASDGDLRVGTGQLELGLAFDSRAVDDEMGSVALGAPSIERSSVSTRSSEDDEDDDSAIAPLRRFADDHVDGRGESASVGNKSPSMSAISSPLGRTRLLSDGMPSAGAMTPRSDDRRAGRADTEPLGSTASSSTCSRPNGERGQQKHPYVRLSRQTLASASPQGTGMSVLATHGQSEGGQGSLDGERAANYGDAGPRSVTDSPPASTIAPRTVHSGAAESVASGISPHGRPRVPVRVSHASRPDAAVYRTGYFELRGDGSPELDHAGTMRLGEGRVQAHAAVMDDTASGSPPLLPSNSSPVGSSRLDAFQLYNVHGDEQLARIAYGSENGVSILHRGTSDAGSRSHLDAEAAAHSIVLGEDDDDDDNGEEDDGSDDNDSGNDVDASVVDVETDGTGGKASDIGGDRDVGTEGRILNRSKTTSTESEEPGAGLLSRRKPTEEGKSEHAYMNPNTALATSARIPRPQHRLPSSARSVGASETPGSKLGSPTRLGAAHASVGASSSGTRMRGASLGRDAEPLGLTGLAPASSSSTKRAPRIMSACDRGRSVDSMPIYVQQSHSGARAPVWSSPPHGGSQVEMRVPMDRIGLVPSPSGQRPQPRAGDQLYSSMYAAGRDKARIDANEAGNVSGAYKSHPEASECSHNRGRSGTAGLSAYDGDLIDEMEDIGSRTGSLPTPLDESRSSSEVLRGAMGHHVFPDWRYGQHGGGRHIAGVLPPTREMRERERRIALNAREQEQEDLDFGIDEEHTPARASVDHLETEAKTRAGFRGAGSLRRVRHSLGGSSSGYGVGAASVAALPSVAESQCSSGSGGGRMDMQTDSAAGLAAYDSGSSR